MRSEQTTMLRELDPAIICNNLANIVENVEHNYSDMTPKQFISHEGVKEKVEKIFYDTLIEFYNAKPNDIFGRAYLKEVGIQLKKENDLATLIFKMNQNPIANANIDFSSKINEQSDKYHMQVNYLV